MSVKRFRPAWIALATAGILAAGCTGGGERGYEKADIRFSPDGTVRCTPASNERSGHDRVVRELQLDEGESVRLCVLTSTVRHAQWIEEHSPPSSQARAELQPALSDEVTSAVRGSFDARNRDGVRSYLLRSGGAR